jgi:hypothetical protein
LHGLFYRHWRTVRHLNNLSNTLKNAITIIMAAAISTGCATNNMGAQFAPIVDHGGNTEMALYQKDLKECQAYAAQEMSTHEKAAAAAVTAAVFGAILAGALGAKGYRNETSAAYGVVGGTAAAVNGVKNQHDIIRKCLSGRGHKVLN